MTATGAPSPPRRALKIFWRRLARRRIAILSLCVCVLAVALVAFGPTLALYDPLSPNIAKRLQGPTFAHPFGTDEIGRDVLSRVLCGARPTLALGLISIGLALSIGVTLGLVSGGCGGLADALIMRLMDLMLALPYFLLALTLVAALGPGYRNSVIAIGVWMIPHFTRLVRGQVLVLRESDFVQAAYGLGETRASVLFRYLLPNCVSPTIVQTTLYLPRAIMLGASLGFLGLSIQPPTPEWGVLIATSREYMLTAPHVLLFPSLALLVVSVAFNLLGDDLRDILDPNLQDIVR